MSNVKTKYLPISVSDADCAFGGQAMKILPPYSEIPEEFKRCSGVWVNWASDWFYNGLKRYPAQKEGIDMNAAMRNLQCIQGSWEPKHEHKAAGVAYLASMWFSSPNGKEMKAAS